MDRSRGRIGLIVPSSNTNVEPDFAMLVPDGVTVHSTRVGLYDVDAIPDVEEMRKYSSEELETAVALLTAAGAGVIAYACTGATLWNGPAFDRQLTLRIEALGGAAAVSAAGSLVEALAALGVGKIGLGTPYAPDMSAQTAQFLEAAGLTVLRNVDLGRALSSREQRSLTPDVAQDLGRRADHPQAEAVVLSCTDLRSLEVVQALEQDLGKPIVTSNQALIWACLGRLGIDRREITSAGKLFQAAEPALEPLPA